MYNMALGFAEIERRFMGQRDARSMRLTPYPSAMRPTSARRIVPGQPSAGSDEQVDTAPDSGT